MRDDISADAEDGGLRHREDADDADEQVGGKAEQHIDLGEHDVAVEEIHQRAAANRPVGRNSMKMTKMKNVTPMLHSPGITNSDRFCTTAIATDNAKAPVMLPTPPAIIAMVAVSNGVTP